MRRFGKETIEIGVNLIGEEYDFIYIPRQDGNVERYLVPRDQISDFVSGGRSTIVTAYKIDSMKEDGDGKNYYKTRQVFAARKLGNIETAILNSRIPFQEVRVLSPLEIGELFMGVNGMSVVGADWLTQNDSDGTTVADVPIIADHTHKTPPHERTRPLYEIIKD